MVSMVGTSFLKLTGPHIISFQEDLIDLDVHMTQGEQGAHMPFRAVLEKQAGGQNSVLWGEDQKPRDRIFQITGIFWTSESALP